MGVCISYPANHNDDHYNGSSKLRRKILAANSSSSSSSSLRNDSDTLRPLTTGARKTAKVSRQLSFASSTTLTESESRFGSISTLDSSGFRCRRPTSLPFASHSTTTDSAGFEITKNENEEFGYVTFEYHSVQDALSCAKATKKPVFCIRAELPGDVDTGREVFSHPLIVEAIDSLFISVNPVVEGCPKLPRSETGRLCNTQVTLLDEYGRDLVPMICANNLTRAELVAAMIRALQIRENSVPKYLLMLSEEENGRSLVCRSSGLSRSREKKAIFGLAETAVRNGEAEFGGMGGVLATHVGMSDRQPVIEITYDSQRLSYGELVRHAMTPQICTICYYQSHEERIAATMEVTRAQRSARLVKYDSKPIQSVYDPKHALRTTPMKFVPLTEYQATRANQLIHYGKFDEAIHLLSSRQGIILMQAMRTTVQKTMYELVDYPILTAWISLCRKQHPKNLVPIEMGCSDDESCDDDVIDIYPNALD